MTYGRRFYLALGVFLLGLWLVAAWVYPHMPERMVTHWGFHGRPDGWMPRLWGVLFGPLMVTVLALLYFFVVPAIEPWKRNLAAFWDAYVLFGWWLLLFLTGMYGVTLAWNLGYAVDILRVVSLSLGLLFLALAPLLRQARPNWFFGVRTPWTLSSPWVWHRVHQMAAKTLVPVALLYFLGLVWPWLGLVAVAATLLWAVGLVVYSYWLYRGRQREAEA